VMGRTFWFVAGASAGLYTTIKARRLASRLTPEGITDQVAALGLGARAFADEVRAGMAEREAQIAHQLALPAVDAGHARERAPQPALEDAAASRRPALAATRS
jgi:Family of unknown function (DUF6167)